MRPARRARHRRVAPDAVAASLTAATAAPALGLDGFDECADGQTAQFFGKIMAERVVPATHRRTTPSHLLSFLQILLVLIRDGNTGAAAG